MILLGAILTQLLHVALMLAAAPLLVGVVRSAKARLLGRRGPPVRQPWLDLLRLLAKRPVIATSATPLFRPAPALALIATCTAAALVPSFAGGMLFAGVGDLLVIAGLLGLARAVQAAAALDAGTAFGGLGASREMAFATFAEPALLLSVLIFAMLAGTTNLDAVAASLRDAPPGLRVSLGLAALAMLAVAVAENARIPVDNPATHLELTMVHEAGLLEYSGPDLALWDMQAALKLLLWLTLLSALFVPFGMAPSGAGPLAWIGGLLAWGAKMGVLAVALASFEVSIAKMRIFRVAEFLGAALLLALLAAVFLFVSTGLA